MCVCKCAEIDSVAHFGFGVVQVAGNQGRAVGKTIAEGKGQPFVKVPIFWSARKCFLSVCYKRSLTSFSPCAEGQQLRYCGVGVGFDDVYIDGNPAELKVCYLAYASVRVKTDPGLFSVCGVLYQEWQDYCSSKVCGFMD